MGGGTRLPGWREAPHEGECYRPGLTATNAVRRLITAVRSSGPQHLLRLAETLTRRQAFLTQYPVDMSPRWGWERPANAALEAVLAPGLDAFRLARERVRPHVPFLADIPRRAPRGCLQWENGFWDGLDAGFLCASLIDRAPARYVEVGSGYSTMFARRAIERHGLATTITSIDPAPLVPIDGLCDNVIRRPLQQVPLELFTSLEPGDVVLFDGSHETYMGSDSVVMLLEILPALPKGVLVGFDDVFLPWDYPASWSRRFYAEQYLLGSYLLGGSAGITVVLPAFYLTRSDPADQPLDREVPNLGSFGKALWLEAA